MLDGASQIFGGAKHTLEGVTLILEIATQTLDGAIYMVSVSARRCAYCIRLLTAKLIMHVTSII